MSAHDRQRSSITEAEWHLAAAEYRVFLAMRRRAQGDDSIGNQTLSHLFDDLVAAIADHRAAMAREDPAGDRGVSANEAYVADACLRPTAHIRSDVVGSDEGEAEME